MANLRDPTFDEPRGDKEGYRATRARVGYELGTRRLGVSLWELPPGEAAYPYHFHLAEEELLVVIGGTPELRTPQGVRTLEEGEIVSFGVGEEGAHQVINRGDEVVRFLAVSTNGEPDVVLYPDSGKVFAGERLPQGGGVRLFFRQADAVDYWADEPPLAD